MEAQNIEYGTSENINDSSNLLDHFWPEISYESVANNSYVERFTPLEAYDEHTKVCI